MTLTVSKAELAEMFKVREIAQGVVLENQPRYNIAPSQQIVTVTESEHGRVLDEYRWGLIPSWADDPKIGYKMINARCETLAEKSTFKKLPPTKRCLIPADGFYEWKGEKNKKQPFYIHMKDGRAFAFAGLWSPWRPKGSDQPWLKTCTIITTAANELMRPLHNRMPVILDEESAEAWLNPDNAETAQLLELLRPYRSEDMEAYPVSKLVNKPTVDCPQCLDPDSNGGEVIVNSA
jgi:putative SOS response-associated peptidase YedK